MKRLFAICLLAGAIVAVEAVFAQGFGTPRRSIRSRGLSSRQQQAPQQTQAPVASSASAGGDSSGLNFNQTPIDLVFETYGKMVEKTVLKDPQTPNATITLKSEPGQKLSKEEQIEAIEIILEMNGVHLEPYQEKFVRALPRKDARKEGIPLIMDVETKLKESGRVVSMMIPFKNISTEEAQKALEGFKSNSGILLVFERTNSILVTDTEQNINRMLEIAKAIDIATPVGEVVEYIQIKNANANEIKQVIDAIVQESQKELEKNGKAPAAQAQPQRPQFGRPGLLNRNRQPEQPQPVNNESLIMSVSDADRGMIRGKVVSIADERSNKILLITSASNMKFFKEVIAALDVETTPDTVVRVYRLKYAEAEDVSDMINDLIGNSVGSKDSKGNQNQNAKKGTSGSVTRGNQQASKATSNQRSGEAKAGELTKDNTTVLADKRINGIVVMTNKDLVPTIEEIIEAMDVKLDQVLIETVIIEVGLDDNIKTGIDWVHGMQNEGEFYKQAIGGGGGTATPVSGGSGSNDVGRAFIDGAMTALPTIFAPGSAGLTYALFSDKFDLGAVISASQGDTHSKYLASPVVMTVDNKEASIEATQMRYLFKGYQYSGSTYNGSAVPDYEQKEIGITVKVTPKINPNGTVMLTVEEEYSQEGTDQMIEGQEGKKFAAATTITRKMQSDVSLDNGQTVVFGGMTTTYTKESETGIPFLKDIPVVGKYLFGTTSLAETRNELLVFMTPYVLKDGDEAQAEALRRKKALSDQRPWQDHGWSKSALADPVGAKEQLRRQKEEWKKLDEEHKTNLELERAKKDRVKELKRRAKQEAEKRMQEEERDAEDAADEAKDDAKMAEDLAKRKAELAKELNRQEEERAKARAEQEAEDRKNNPLLKQLHEEYGIPESK